MDLLSIEAMIGVSDDAAARVARERNTSEIVGDEKGIGAQR